MKIAKKRDTLQEKIELLKFVQKIELETIIKKKDKTKFIIRIHIVENYYIWKTDKKRYIINISYKDTIKRNRKFESTLSNWYDLGSLTMFLISHDIYNDFLLEMDRLLIDSL